MAVRIGFVGTGGIAANHFGNLEKIEDARIVGLYDVAPERAEAAARRSPGSRAYPSFVDMLESAGLDALYVCVPPHAHQDYEVLAAERGIHLFVEKPISTALSRAREVAAAISEAGVISSVGYNWRYLDTTARAREIIAGKAIALAQGYWVGGFPQVSWWRVKEQSGGQAVEQTTHIFDLARYLLGEVESVYALGFKGLMADWPGCDVEDASAVALRFKSGTVATINSADIAPRGGGTIGLQLYSRDLVVSLMSTRLKVSTPLRSEEMLAGVNPYAVEDQTFVEAVKTGDASAIRSTYADAVRTLAVTLAVNESIASGRVISVE